MATTNQLLPAIRALAGRYGLPDGLELYQHGMAITTSRSDYLYYFDSDYLYIPLAAALAHWETRADQQGISLHTDRLCCRCCATLHEQFCGFTRHTYTPGDLLSRLTARTLALLDGVNAIEGEG